MIPKDFWQVWGLVMCFLVGLVMSFLLMEAHPVLSVLALCALFSAVIALVVTY